jgi:hypothetical protein
MTEKRSEKRSEKRKSRRFVELDRKSPAFLSGVEDGALSR